MRRGPRSWPVQVFVDLSTAHIPERDGLELLGGHHTRVLAELEDGAGHLLHISDWAASEIRGEGFSQEFADLVQLLQMDGFTHLRLDRDGRLVKNLRTYKW